MRTKKLKAQINSHLEEIFECLTQMADVSMDEAIDTHIVIIKKLIDTMPKDILDEMIVNSKVNLMGNDIRYIG
jgi:hypothetical protein